MKRIALFLVLFIVLWTTNVLAAGDAVVSLGADLNEDQQQQMLRLFDVEKEDVKIITVTNKEERELLGGIAPKEKIGTRAISSAYVEQLGEDEGISVETYNLDWVTEEMITNALLTAGIKDARVIAAAPFKVSGTAALTGITKAFEEATGKKLDPDAKDAANEELVKTGELGDEIGKENATDLIQKIKEKIIKEKIKDPEQIKTIIIQIAGDLNINLNAQQLEELTALMEKISKLNLNVDDIRTQLKNITGQLEKIQVDQEEVKGILAKLLDLLGQFIDWLKGLFS